jgi:hypothetical protein
MCETLVPPSAATSAVAGFFIKLKTGLPPCVCAAATPIPAHKKTKSKGARIKEMFILI